MKKTNFWGKIKKGFFKVEKQGEKVILETGKMAKELEKMGQLGGQLFIMKVG